MNPLLNENVYEKQFLPFFFQPSVLSRTGALVSFEG